jgi:hypothetical protein
MKTVNDVQVGTKIATKHNSRLSHLESVALGLLVLAIKSNYFKKELVQYLFENDLILPKTITNQGFYQNYESIKWILPINPSIAESKLKWLVNEIEYVSDAEREKIIRILDLAYRKPVPEMAAWGIVFNETLGVFVAGHPFFVDRHLEYSQAIILSPNWRNLEPQNLTKQISRISLMTLTKCIEEAELDFKRLEPEVSSWLLEGKNLELYVAKNEKDFKGILTHLSNSGIIYTSISNEINLIALQPSVTGSYETLFAKLTLL